MPEFCTFELAGLHFGVEVRRVQEVIRPQPLTAVPRAPHTIEGLINLRGQIVTAIDLRRRFELPGRDDGAAGMNVVVRTGDGEVSLLVDRIGDVVTVEDDRFEATPDTVDGVARELLTGAYKLDDRLLLIVDVDRAVELPSAA